jgi:hypothetical protein
MISPNSIVHLAHVHVDGKNYNIAISMCLVTRHIHIFKYNDYGCDYDIFDNQADACTFIEKPMPK